MQCMLGMEAEAGSKQYAMSFAIQIMESIGESDEC